jgi:hypothetical protein
LNTAPQPQVIPYDIELHVHRLAAWAASTAASSARGKRFKVASGVLLIEKIGLNRLVGTPDKLPDPKDLDVAHEKWRCALLKAAEESGMDFFTHGLAAKLINVYLKVAFVNTAHAAHPKVAALHPPIDRELLSGLIASTLGTPKTWRRFRDDAWSKFDSKTYQDVIDAVREALPEGQALWTIEEHWKGYQGQLDGQQD